MPTNQHLIPRRRPFVLLALGVMIFLSSAFMLAVMPRAAAAPQDAPIAEVAAGPDLTVEIFVDPPSPSPNTDATLIFRITNRGTSSTGQNVQFYYYIDPITRPPYGAVNPRPGSVPALAAGQNFDFKIEGYQFTTVGCDHVLYGWVDPNGLITESDEDNNQQEHIFCVGVECDPDGYDVSNAVNDNQCSVGTPIFEGEPQSHTFCHASNLETTDTDWVKFTAFQGVTYTLNTSNLGTHANPRITLRSACNGSDLLTGEQMLSWLAPVGGIYYARLENDPQLQGPLTNFSLTLSATTGLNDNYEPDDVCGQARDITTDGVKQSHLFQSPGDADWVKFSTTSGESFVLITSNTGPGISPSVSVFAGCSQARSSAALISGVTQVSARSTQDQIYYARITNQNPDRFGANAKYDVAVVASQCADDTFEENDVLNQAKDLAVGGGVQRHNVCPAGDQDWVKFNLTAGEIYIIQTSNLDFAADTVLDLYNEQGTLLASNDDYNYVEASRIVFEPSTSGTYYARATHHQPTAAGVNTGFDLSITTGFCSPDLGDAAAGDNSPADAPQMPTSGTPQPRNFCADPQNLGVGDQDWVSFSAVAGGNYQIQTTGLGPNSDTVLRLYAPDGITLLQTNDDAGPGRSAQLVFTPTVPGEYYVQVTQYNSNVNGPETEYEVRVVATIPPTPTPTNTPTPTPTPTSTPVPAVDQSTVKTLILTNRQQLETLYGATNASLVMAKLFELADNERVEGGVILVENDPATAAAYTDWLAVLANNAATNTQKNDAANNVAAAIRNIILSFSGNSPTLQYVVLVGDDRVVPFRRVHEGTLSDQEAEYAPDVSPDTTIQAALAENMILTDDYFVDIEPSQWKGNDLFLPDYAIGRLIETPSDILTAIDTFLADPVNEVSNVLITGYDFMQDSAAVMNTLFSNDNIATDAVLIGTLWTGNQLRDRQINSSVQFNVQAINGHSTHVATGAPNASNINANGILAGEVLTASTNYSGTLIFAVGCHAGLNDPGVLDLPQAFVSRGANYVGNTGFGWGGGGVVLSESLMRNYTLELVRNTTAKIGPALVAAKKRYWSNVFVFGAYDAKILMQSTLYGLPMAEVTSGGTLTDDDPFPSVETTIQPPTSFGALSKGSFNYGLPASFGAFGESDTTDGSIFDLDQNTYFAPGAPVQPHFYANVEAPAAGTFRGTLFRGGVYSDVTNFDPVVGLAYNEYVDSTAEPTFNQPGWFPTVPYAMGGGDRTQNGDTLVLSLGQFDSSTNTQRIFGEMALETLYSSAADQVKPEVLFVDGVFNSNTGKGLIKVEGADAGGISQVVVAFTDNLLNGQGEWYSTDLIFDDASQKWTGEITGTVQTVYFAQLVDIAGNITVADNKGRYYSLQSPLPLAQGTSSGSTIYLPAISRP